MRLIRVFAVVQITWVLYACQSNDPHPVLDELMPLSFKEGNLTKTLTHDDAGKLVKIQYVTRFSDSNELTSFHYFSYTNNGRLIESTTDTGWRYVYLFSDNNIVRTDEYLNGDKSDYHTFEYDSKNRLIKRVTYQDIPAEGGEIPISKETYEYDQNDNLVLLRLYYYTSFGQEAKLLSEFEFSGYDNKINSEKYFDIMGINPDIRLRKNNPGKMVLKNSIGEASITEEYTYTYHTKGYVAKKLVNTTLYNGTKGSYEAFYTFKE